MGDVLILYRACTVLVPFVHASTGNVPTYPRLCSYCTCTVAQCVLYCASCTMNRRARVRTRTVVIPLRSVYRACTSCIVGVWPELILKLVCYILRADVPYGVRLG